MKMNDLKQRMQAGEAVYGIFINSGSTIAVEAAALAGFDFVLIDSEHGPTMPQANRDLICAAEYRDAGQFNGKGAGCRRCGALLSDGQPRRGNDARGGLRLHAADERLFQTGE